jgi:hypothetical protein
VTRALGRGLPRPLEAVRKVQPVARTQAVLLYRSTAAGSGISFNSVTPSERAM